MDILNLQYDCNVCKDKGFLENGHKCNCLKQQIINEAYKMSNLSRMLKNQNFYNFRYKYIFCWKNAEFNISPQQNMLQIVSICESFVLNFDKDNGWKFIILWWYWTWKNIYV